MNPFLLLIGNQEWIVNVVATNPDRIIFTNPLTISHVKMSDDKPQITLNAPTWLRCTPDRDFSIEKSKITMMLTPTNNLKSSYIKIITDLHESQKKAQKEASKGNTTK